MLWNEIKAIKSGKKELREFGVVVGGVLVAIAGFLFWKEKPTAVYFLATGTAIVVSGVLFPIILKPFQKIWMSFAVIMGFFMSHVVLGVLFYGVLAPIRFISVLLGQHFLDLKIDKSSKSYWNYRKDAPIDRSRYEHPF